MKKMTFHISQQNMLRIADALLRGWALGHAGPPPNAHSRGHIWIAKEPNQWVCYKGSGKHWLKEALNEAGIRP